MLIIKINDCKKNQGIPIYYNDEMMRSIISSPTKLNDIVNENHNCMAVGKYSDNIVDAEHFEFADVIMLVSNLPLNLLTILANQKIKCYVYSLTTSKKECPHYLVLFPLNQKILNCSDYEKKSKMIIDYLGSEKFDNHFVKPTLKVYFPPLVNENTDYEYYAFDGDTIDRILFDLNKADDGTSFQMNVSNELKLNNLKSLVNEPMIEDVEIIEGVAREGYIALFAAPSKAGKSQIMIELSIAVATGSLWLNKYKCSKGNVLYINTEINKKDITKRFMDTIEAYGVDKDRVLEHIWLMNLRGHSKSLDDIKSQIIEESILKNVKLIILDPIYKLQNGDENSVRDVTEFMDTAIQIGEKTHALVMMVHHYSKGSKDNVNSLDRSSGSGSFARAVDSYLDCVEINPEMPDEDMIKYENTSFFRISMILRSYPNSEPVEIAYEYPKHYVVSGLESAEIKKSGSKKTRNKLNENKLKSEKLEHAISSVGNRVIDVANFIGVHENTISNWLKVLPDWEKRNGYLLKKQL